MAEKHTRLLTLPEVCTKQQVALALGVSVKQVQRYISKRLLRASRLGHRTVRIERESVVRFLDRC